MRSFSQLLRGIWAKQRPKVSPSTQQFPFSSEEEEAALDWAAALLDWICVPMLLTPFPALELAGGTGQGLGVHVMLFMGDPFTCRQWPGVRSKQSPLLKQQALDPSSLLLAPTLLVCAALLAAPALLDCVSALLDCSCVLLLPCSALELDWGGGQVVGEQVLLVIGFPFCCRHWPGGRTKQSPLLMQQALPDSSLLLAPMLLACAELLDPSAVLLDAPVLLDPPAMLLLSSPALLLAPKLLDCSSALLLSPALELDPEEV